MKDLELLLLAGAAFLLLSGRNKTESPAGEGPGENIPAEPISEEINLPQFSPVVAYGYDVFGFRKQIYGDAATYDPERFPDRPGAIENKAAFDALLALGFSPEQLFQGAESYVAAANNPYFHEYGRMPVL